MRVLPFVIALVFLGMAMKKGRIARDKIYLVQPASVARYLTWCVLFFVFILVTEFALAKVGLLGIDKWNHALIPSIIRIAGAVILAPLVEEIILRGVLLSKLIEKGLNQHVAIVLQAMVFVALHSFAYQGTLSSQIAIVQSLVDGILYGYARQNTGSLYTPITMHIMGNLIATVERFIV